MTLKLMAIKTDLVRRRAGLDSITHFLKLTLKSPLQLWKKISIFIPPPKKKKKKITIIFILLVKLYTLINVHIFIVLL